VGSRSRAEVIESTMSTAVDPHVIGEHIRRLRSERGLSVRGFAAQTGFSASFISQLENGQVAPSLGSLHKIAEALGVTLGEFFAAAEMGEEPLIVRPGDRRRLDSTWTDAHIEALGAMRPSHKLEPMIAIFGPGGKSGNHPHAQSRDEFAFVLKGEVTLTLADEENTMRAGDAVTLPANAPRRWENRTQEIAEILMISAR
jgi:XRE family transcriptional regulator, regulator of sulfur utilization